MFSVWVENKQVRKHVLQYENQISYIAKNEKQKRQQQKYPNQITLEGHSLKCYHLGMRQWAIFIYFSYLNLLNCNLEHVLFL